jgi:glycosyltransferase involved in cell wall biosynthesis
VPKHTSKPAVKPKVALIGSRGIPPKYGGAEVFAYELSKRLKDEFEVYVTCETDHFGIDEYEGIKRVHVKARHKQLLTVPAVYDIVETIYLLTKVKDLNICYYLLPDGAFAALIARLAGRKTLVNTDGLEWKRMLVRIKYAPIHRKPLYLAAGILLLISEFLSCKIPHATVADSLAIKKYLERRWRPKNVVYVAYGARPLPKVSEKRAKRILEKIGLEPYEYYLTISRLLPENNIHIEIEAIKKINTRRKLVIVGPVDQKEPYVQYLLKLKGNDSRIIFTGAIYNPEIVSALRANCKAYIHAYTMGGTNPSLLEQMLYNRPIIAYDVPFHREILREKGYYFKTTDELAQILNMIEAENITLNFMQNLAVFSWNFITQKYKKILRMMLINKNYLEEYAKL